MDAQTIGVQDLTVKTEKQATDSIGTISSAIAQVSEQRSRIGAQQNRLEHAYKINENTSENTQYAESQIRDADMAEFMVKQVKESVLKDAAQSMLAQANHSNENVLRILF